jgi:uncharacterized protein (DUF1501 family)
MNAPMITSRRGVLVGAASFGLSLQLLALPAVAADADLAKRKVIVVICRGGMDGLSVAPPSAIPSTGGLRGALALNGTALPLDGTFGLHPALTSVQALAQAGEARIAPAIATPDRARSHFEAQDVLETGAAGVYTASSGWLNRAVEALSAHPQGGRAVGGPDRAADPARQSAHSLLVAGPDGGRRGSPADPAAGPLSQRSAAGPGARPRPRHRGHGQGRRRRTWERKLRR